VTWLEEVESLKVASTNDLQEMLGIPKKRLPFFNQTQDAYGNHDPWVEGEKAWFADPVNIQPLIPQVFISYRRFDKLIYFNIFPGISIPLKKKPIATC